MTRITILLLALASACGQPEPGAEGGEAPVEHRVEAPAPPAEAPEPSEAAPEPVNDTPVPPSPQELYEACRDRVEQPQVDGECETDADCVRAGCSQEICTSTEAAADVMSTCEMRPCFEILDACGCVDGRCTWSIKDARPAREGRPLPAP